MFSQQRQAVVVGFAPSRVIQHRLQVTNRRPDTAKLVRHILERRDQSFEGRVFDFQEGRKLSLVGCDKLPDRRQCVFRPYFGEAWQRGCVKQGIRHGGDLLSLSLASVNPQDVITGKNGLRSGYLPSIRMKMSSRRNKGINGDS